MQQAIVTTTLANCAIQIMKNPALIEVKASDGVSLAVSTIGEGEPIVFLHEYSGDLLSWEKQVTALSNRYRCIRFNARGYPPSQVPESIDDYAQARAADDATDVMAALGIERAYFVGLSMGGFAALHVAIRHPERLRALVVAGCGYGSLPSEQEMFFADMNREADHADAIGMSGYAAELANSGYAQLLRAKSYETWNEFREQLTAHSAKGMAMTLRGVLARRPSLWHLEPQLKKIGKPVLLVIGDEDVPCLEPNLFLKKTLPDCALSIMPRTGHLPNLEDPDVFNALIDRFFISVGDNSWNRTTSAISSKD
jgi:pimeloyl-ACP methyl ester carboxylesterase